MSDDSTERLSCKDFYESLVGCGIEYFTGVPDSLVGPFSIFLGAKSKKNHLIAANEGNAIGIAIGYHSATAKIPFVYMQNSGLANALDPLVSLVDSSVLNVPMLLMIGWRGQPETKDEPQHTKQGAITCDLLDLMEIPYETLKKNHKNANNQVKVANDYIRKFHCPYALLVAKNTFEEPDQTNRKPGKYLLSREQAIEGIVQSLDSTDAVVASIGKTSRELFEYRERNGQTHEQDLLIVGGMGHASSVALGIAEQKPNQKVYCLDGDGSALMHLGSLATIGARNCRNYRHIVLNNGLHDSVGGQPTVGLEVNLPAIAKACGYSHVYTTDNLAEVRKYIKETKNVSGSIFLEVKIHGGARENLSRPSISPNENKESFMKFLAKH